METSKLIFSVLDELAIRLSGTATHIWEIMVRHQITSGIVNLLWALPMGAITFFGVKYLVSLLKKGYQGRTGDEDIMIPVFIGVVLIAGTFTVVSLDAAINSLVNPEYFAIKELLATIKK